MNQTDSQQETATVALAREHVFKGEDGPRMRAAFSNRLRLGDSSYPTEQPPNDRETFALMRDYLLAMMTVCRDVSISFEGHDKQFVMISIAHGPHSTFFYAPCGVDGDETPDIWMARVRAFAQKVRMTCCNNSRAEKLAEALEDLSRLIARWICFKPGDILP